MHRGRCVSELPSSGCCPHRACSLPPGSQLGWLARNAVTATGCLCSASAASSSNQRSTPLTATASSCLWLQHVEIVGRTGQALVGERMTPKQATYRPFYCEGDEAPQEYEAVSDHSFERRAAAAAALFFLVLFWQRRRLRLLLRCRRHCWPSNGLVDPLVAAANAWLVDLTLAAPSLCRASTSSTSGCASAQSAPARRLGTPAGSTVRLKLAFRSLFARVLLIFLLTFNSRFPRVLLTSRSF